MIIDKIENYSGKKIYKLGNHDILPAAITSTGKFEADAVYFPCCSSRLMGSKNDKSIIETMLKLSTTAGIKLFLPKDSSGHCCGMAFSSKGFKDAYINSIEKLIGKLWEWTYGAKLPVVLDSSSCSFTLLNCKDDLSERYRAKFEKLKIFDSVDFAYHYLMPNLNIMKLDGCIAVHRNCSSQKLGNTEKMISICKKCSEKVFVPSLWNPCVHFQI